MPTPTVPTVRARCSTPQDRWPLQLGMDQVVALQRYTPSSTSRFKARIAPRAPTLPKPRAPPGASGPSSNQPTTSRQSAGARTADMRWLTLTVGTPAAAIDGTGSTTPPILCLPPSAPTGHCTTASRDRPNRSSDGITSRVRGTCTSSSSGVRPAWRTHRRSGQACGAVAHGTLRPPATYTTSALACTELFDSFGSPLSVEILSYNYSRTRSVFL